MRKPPVFGVTKCPGCRKPLDDGRELAGRDVEEYGYGTSSSGFTYRHITPTKVTQKWHAECLAKFNRDFVVSQAKLAVSSAQDRLETTREICAASTETDPEKVAKLNAHIEKAERELAEAQKGLEDAQS